MKGIRRKFIRKEFKKKRGQSLVETALMFPVLLILLSGLVEFGFLLNEYLTILDAARNAARFSSDSLYNAADSDQNCNTTRDFFRQTTCLVNQELRQEQPLVEMNDNGTPGMLDDDYLDPNRGDDIIVSAFSIAQGIGVTARYPAGYGDSGWSYSLDFPTYNIRNESSMFTSADIEAKLDANAPNTGFVMVEIFYLYPMKLRLPWITMFIDDPVPLHVFTLMPLVSAEPTPTPIP